MGGRIQEGVGVITVDAIYIAVMAGFFAVTWGFVRLCARL
jgi:hypothetical protein